MACDEQSVLDDAEREKKGSSSAESIIGSRSKVPRWERWERPPVTDPIETLDFPVRFRVS